MSERKKSSERHICGKLPREEADKFDKICEALGLSKITIVTAVVKKIIALKDKPKETEEFLKVIGLKKKEIWSL
jgi:hypothetical protein